MVFLVNLPLAVLDDAQVGHQVRPEAFVVPVLGGDEEVQVPAIIREGGLHHDEFVGHPVRGIPEEVHLPVAGIKAVSLEDEDERKALGVDIELKIAASL